MRGETSDGLRAGRKEEAVGEDRKQQAQRIRAARDWLDEAGDSLEQGAGLKGDLKVMLAEAELARANVVDPTEVPPTIVTMNSTVRFSVESTQNEFELTLVYPKDVDASGKTISILAPVGGALLGLSQGDEIEWPKPGGGVLKVKITGIVYQPERAGEYQR